MRTYDALQNFVHRGHHSTFGLLYQLLDLSLGDTVIEVGCGTGNLAHYFVAGGFDYWGIDLDVERIAAARQRVPGAHFLVGDATCLGAIGLPRFRHVFIHGVLHHLNDTQCHHLIDSILSRDSEIVVVVIEPFRPSPWRINPFGTLFAWMDEGKHVRLLSDWQNLYGPNLDMHTTYDRRPRWPVEFLAVRLIAR